MISQPWASLPLTQRIALTSTGDLLLGAPHLAVIRALASGRLGLTGAPEGLDVQERAVDALQRHLELEADEAEADQIAAEAVAAMGAG